MNKVIIFYSWQSDLSNKTNRSAIQAALHQIASDLISDEYDIVIDEATRDEPGSPNIPHTILSKIASSDIFIADISTINKGDKSRKTPNPNVMFELGYANSMLGLKRILMIANAHFTDIKLDPPFDIDRNKIISYEISTETAKTNQQIKTEIAKLLKPAIELILKKNPTKDANFRQMTDEQIRRMRDVDNIIWILESINLPSLQSHWEQGPRYLDSQTLWHWEDYHSVFSNALFELNDKSLYDIFGNLHKTWAESIDGNYRQINNSQRLVWATPLDLPFTNKDEQQKWNKTNRAHNQLPKIITSLKDYLSIHYVEVNIKETSKKAFQKYINEQKEFMQELEMNGNKDA